MEKNFESLNNNFSIFPGDIKKYLNAQLLDLKSEILSLKGIVEQLSAQKNFDQEEFKNLVDSLNEQYSSLKQSIAVHDISMSFRDVVLADLDVVDNFRTDNLTLVLEPANSVSLLEELRIADCLDETLAKNKTQISDPITGPSLIPVEKNDQAPDAVLQPNFNLRISNLSPNTTEQRLVDFIKTTFNCEDICCKSITPRGLKFQPKYFTYKISVPSSTVKAIKKSKAWKPGAIVTDFKDSRKKIVLSTKLLGKRNVKLKSVTIIHSATTETVRLPEDNNGVIVHKAVRTKVPFKKKVRGQRGHKAKIITKKSNQQNTTSKPKSNGSNGDSSSTPPQSLPNQLTSHAIIATSSININKNPFSVTNTIVKTKIPTVLNKRSSSSEIFKTVYRRKNRSNIGEKAVNKINDYKNAKKSKKKKEVIDYSKGSGGPNVSRHTNTFGKVQKWLLDSPIVAEPLPHLEHSSEIRNIMAKSQSIPDRLVQKTLQKTKSIGNLSNEKVKLQVVYKPPFKFSLKLSTNSTVKTHIINSALNKSKRKTRSIGVDCEKSYRLKNKKKIGVAPLTSLKSSQVCERRSAFLIKCTDKTEGQKLNLADSLEPNYETLEHPDKMSDKTPLYENIYINSTENLKDLNNTIEKNDNRDFSKFSSKERKIPHGFRINRSASNSYIDSRKSRLNKNFQPQSYSYSNSVSHNAGDPFLKPILSLRKTSDNSLNFYRNFGSTQNLIAYNHNNLPISKPRKSLNLKNNTESSSSDTKPPSTSKKPTPDAVLFASTGSVLPRQNNFNQSLSRENADSNLRFTADNYDNVTVLLPQHTDSTANLLKVSSSGNTKGSIRNIPRAYLSNNSTTATTNGLLIGASQQLNNLSNTSTNNQYHHQQQRTPSPSNNINNMNSNSYSLKHQQSEKSLILNYNIFGNQLNNLNKSNTSDSINTRQLPIDLPPPNKKQLSQLSASEDHNYINQSNCNTQSKNSSNNNSSSNPGISNNGGNSNCNNITNISANIPVISNVLNQSSYNFLLTSQQNFTTTPFISASTKTNKTNLNKKISNTSTLNNSVNNIYNSANSKNQKNVLGKSKNFNNKTSPKPTKASTSSSAISSTINTNNDFEISPELDVEILVS